MARFKGWTAAAVARLTGEQPKPIVKTTKKPVKDYPGYIYEALKQIGIPSVREYRFIKDRRFRFDLAIPEHRLAIEFEGIGNNGRHTRIKGYHNDTKKYNLAQMHGWDLLRYTTLDTNQPNWEYKIADEIKRFIEMGKTREKS